MAGLLTPKLNPPTGSDGAMAVKPRYGVLTTFHTDTVLGDCDVVDIRDFRDIAVKPGATITTITIHASEAADGTFVLVDNIGTNGVVTLPASKWTALDVTKIAPFGFIKIMSSADGEAAMVGKT